MTIMSLQLNWENENESAYVHTPPHINALSIVDTRAGMQSPLYGCMYVDLTFKIVKNE